MDQIVEWIYWSVPGGIQASDVSYATTDSLGMVQMSIVQGLNLGGSDIFFKPLASSFTIKVTPQAFISWYQGQGNLAAQSGSLTFLYQTLLQPVNGYSNTSAQTTAYLKSENYYWKSYGSVNLNNYDVLMAPSSEAAPGGYSTSYGGYTTYDYSNYYALIKAVGGTSTSTVLSGSGSSNVGYYISPQTTQQAQEQASSVVLFNSTTQADAAAATSTAIAAAPTVGSIAAGDVGTAVDNAIGGAAGAAEQGLLSNPIFDMVLFGSLAVLGLIAIAVIVS